MQKQVFDEADKTKLKRIALIMLFVLVFIVVGVTLVLNTLASDDETQQKNTEEIIDLLEG